MPETTQELGPLPKPHLSLLRGGPAAGMWRCMSQNPQHHGGACFGETPQAAYANWERWQEHVKTLPFAYLGVAA